MNRIVNASVMAPKRAKLMRILPLPLSDETIILRGIYGNDDSSPISTRVFESNSFWFMIPYPSSFKPNVAAYSSLSINNN